MNIEVASPHILIIEDDPAVGRSLEDALTGERFRVTWTTTGGAGLAAARRDPPQLFILDVRLPDGSGFDICRELRQEKFHQPILMLTAARDELDKVLGLEMGADDYLTKPYGVRELISRVRAQLRRAYGAFAQPAGDRLTIHDLWVDVSRGQVWRGEEALNLTPTELRLLIFLGRNPGRALSRSQIIEAVWGYDAELESENMVNVHIRRLREKIEPDPGRPTTILTVPGIGYRLADLTD